MIDFDQIFPLFSPRVFFSASLTFSVANRHQQKTESPMMFPDSHRGASFQYRSPTNFLSTSSFAEEHRN